MQGRWQQLEALCQEPGMTLETLQQRFVVADMRFLYNNSVGNAFWINLGIYTGQVTNRALVYQGVFPCVARLFQDDLRKPTNSYPVLYDVLGPSSRTPWRCHLAMALLDVGTWVPRQLGSVTLLNLMGDRDMLSSPGCGAFWMLVRRLLDMGFGVREGSERHDSILWLQQSRQHCQRACWALLGVARRRRDLRVAVPRPVWQQVVRTLWAQRFEYDN